MQNFKEKVMDDLDALLADLQNTTAQINQFQQHPAAPKQHHHQQQHEYSSHSVDYGSQRNRSETPPPLPPPPPQELLDGIPPPKQFDEPMYESQHDVKRHTSSSSTSYSSDPLSFQDTSPASPPLQQQQQQQQQPRQMSALSNNLSELDQLLQDLNSAQFMAEVDKRNVSTTQSQPQHIVNGGGEKVPPPVAPKPNRTEHRSSVDGLLDMLEGSVPDAPSNYRSPPPPVNDNYEYTSPPPAPQQFQYTQSQNQRVEEVSHPPAASTATKELDELMATLSEFKVSGNQPQGRIQQTPVQPPPPRSPSPSSEPPYARPVKSRNSSQSGVNQSQPPPRQELESMLGNLQEDMKSQGVTTKTKGLCGACNQPVVGQVITALGKVWHIEHFVCANCSLPLGTKNFYERDGAAYCEEDYHRIFAPKCAYCNGPIVDKCVTALDMTWHPEHFFCAQCGRPFGEDGFHEKDGKAYCREDYLEMFAPRCGGCGRPILDNYISALNRHWHPECFVCRECHMSFGGRSFFEHEGQPYCETHYHLKRGSLCASCQKPITGRCITAMYKKFHPEHFVCAFCLKQLNKGTFKEQNDKPYCHPCFVKLFG